MPALPVRSSRHGRGHVAGPILALCLVVGGPSICPGQSARPGAAPELAAARRHMQQKQWDSASAVLDRLTAREPDNASAWAMLGIAHHSAGRLDDAVAAHRRAAAFPSTRPAALMNLGLAWALKGDPDQAFRWLAEAKATGRVDMTALDLDPDSKSLRQDARYRALFPSDAEYADPFVEKVRILREWRGEAAGDQFGWIARALGDVDRDGLPDIVVSAPFRNGGAGQVYVYSGRTGAEVWTRSGDPGETLGIGIEKAGDVDGDGVVDVIVGAPGRERAYLLSGAHGRTLHLLRGPAGTEGFGRRVGGVGDADGDGRADVVVGAPGSDAAATDAGRAYLFSGRDGSLLLHWDGRAAGDALGSSVAGGRLGSRTAVIAGEPGPFGGHGGRARVFDAATGAELFAIDADSSGVQLGFMFVSVIGDVDADGTADVWATDFADAARGPATGRAYVHSGATGKRLLTLAGEGPGDGFGIGSAEAGDLNADGHDDIVVGAWRHGSAAPSGGKVYVHSGRDGALLWSITGKVPGETLGFDATGVGDVDRDGVPDLLLTSAQSSIRGARSGRMYLVSGRPPDP